MDVKELDKKHLILLTLLITFVVSIATGIVTVSLMNQMPKSVPQTINNVIQRTIEKVTTVQVPTPAKNENKTSDNSTTSTPTTTTDQNSSLLGNGNTLIPIYLEGTDLSSLTTQQNATDSSSVDQSTTNSDQNINPPNPIGDGVIVSDVGLVLVDSNIIGRNLKYKVVLNKIVFDLSVLKKFDNGFTIMKITPINSPSADNSTTTNSGQ
jgi:hypothetical protein